MHNRHFYGVSDIVEEFAEASRKGRRKRELEQTSLLPLLPEEFPEYGGHTHPVKVFKLYGLETSLREVHAQLCAELAR